MKVFFFTDDGRQFATFKDGKFLVDPTVNKDALGFVLFTMMTQMQEMPVGENLENLIVDIVKRHFGGASYGGPLSAPEAEDIDAGEV